MASAGAASTECADTLGSNAADVFRARCASRLAELALAADFSDAVVVCTGEGTRERVPVVRAVLAAAIPVLEEKLGAAGAEIELPLSASTLRSLVALCCGTGQASADLVTAAELLELPEVETCRIAAFPRAKDNSESDSGHGSLLKCSGGLTLFALYAWSPCVSYQMENNGFFMDDAMISRNSNVVGDKLDWRHLMRTDFWGLDMFEGSWTHKSFRPLTVLTFRWNYLMHGFQSCGFHVANLALHLLCSGLLGFCAKHSLRLPASWSALLAALFFSHPVHTESVLYIVGRADLLCLILLLLSILVYTSPWFSCVKIIVSTCILVAAGLCKETGFCFFGLLAGWEILRILRAGSCWMRWIRLGALLTLGIVTCCLRYWYTGGTTIERMDHHSNPVAAEKDPYVRILTYTLVHGVYARLLVWPTFLCYDYSFDAIPLVRTLLDLRLLLPISAYLALALLVTSALSALRPELPRGRRNLLFPRDNGKEEKETPIIGVAIVILSFFPMSNILFPVGTMVAERLLYMPSAGLLISLVGLGHLTSSRGNGRMRWAPAGALLLFGIFGALLTLSRVPEWSSPQAITIADGLRQTRSTRAQYNLGNFYLYQKNYSEALHIYEHVISLDPTDHDCMPLFHAGQIQILQGNYSSAKSLLARAVAGHFSPLVIKEEEVFHDYGLALWFADDAAGAVENFEKSLVMNATFTKALNNLACAWGLGALMGKLPQEVLNNGLMAMEQAVQLSPSSILYWRNMVALLRFAGQSEAAASAWQQVLALDPSSGAPPEDCSWEFALR